MNRQPVVAGQFYPGSGATLKNQVAGYLQGQPSEERTLLAMVPHAGYVFSGQVAGKTIAQANLAPRIILLGPNHSGKGQRLAVWGDGKWLLPGLEAVIDSQLAQALVGLPDFSSDYEAHLYEHSLEVVVPFLAAVLDDFTMVPVAVAEPDLEVLIETGKSLGMMLKKMDADVSLVVSSDMSHYISHDEAKAIDQKAIDQIMNMNPEGLYRVVRDNNISMCGVLPMVMGLACAGELGAKSALLVDYSTSGEVNNDYSRVVGYAGVLIS